MFRSLLVNRRRPAQIWKHFEPTIRNALENCTMDGRRSPTKVGVDWRRMRHKDKGNAPMNTGPPPIIKAYVDASNRHDMKSILACFSDAAVVRDEQQTHQGKAAIKD